MKTFCIVNERKRTVFEKRYHVAYGNRNVFYDYDEAVKEFKKYSDVDTVIEQVENGVKSIVYRKHPTD